MYTRSLWPGLISPHDGLMTSRVLQLPPWICAPPVLLLRRPLGLCRLPPRASLAPHLIGAIASSYRLPCRLGALARLSRSRARHLAPFLFPRVTVTSCSAPWVDYRGTARIRLPLSFLYIYPGAPSPVGMGRLPPFIKTYTSPLGDWVLI